MIGLSKDLRLPEVRMRVKRRIDEIAEGEGKSGDSRYWIPNVEQAISSRPPFAPVKNLVDRGYAGIKP